MSIVITKSELVSGVPVTSAGTLMRAPWAGSPPVRPAVEQAPAPTITRIGDLVRIRWSPSSGGTPRADISIHVEAHCPTWISMYRIRWGDGSPDTLVPGLGVKDRIFDVSHTFLADSVLITVEAWQQLWLVESAILVIAPSRSANYRIHQYRVERFKGRVGYTEPGQLWVPDWQVFADDAGEMDYYDYSALPRWNWGYRLWLRTLDAQSLPDLVLVPSPWIQTGSGEGS